MRKPLLNIYGQDNPKEGVVIIANKAGLTALQKAIRDARSQKRKGTSKAVASDGNEFELKIHRSTVKWRGADSWWKKLILPYHETVVQEGPTISPWEID